VIRSSGRMRSALIIGGQGIRAHKLRTLLSMLSLFLGVLAVVVVQAGAELANQAVLSNMELTTGKDGTVEMMLPPSATVLPTVLDMARGRSDMVVSMGMDAIIGEPNVTPVNPGSAPFNANMGPSSGSMAGASIVCESNGACVRSFASDAGSPPRGQAIEVNLVAVTGDLRQFRPFRLEAGRWLEFGSTPSLAPRLALNKEAAKGFTRYRVPAQMRIPGASVDPTPQIVGVVDDGNEQPTAYVRADELLNWLPATQLGSEAYGRALELLMSPTATAMQQVLRTRLTAAGLPANQVYSHTIDARGKVQAQLALMRWIFLGMAALVLLIGVAGILNVGLAAVGERVEEFALRRAVGTPRSLLAGIVLAETLLIGLFTTGAAIGTGVVGLKAVSVLLGDRTHLVHNAVFPWQAGVAGVIAGLVAGLLGGFVPAIRAARIPIATVMRA
jgi:putative ABC transport system permease protein